MADLRQKYSLFSIGECSSPDSSTSQAVGSTALGVEELDRAVALYASPILHILGAVPEMAVQDILRQWQAGKYGSLPDYDEFRGLLKRLEQLKLLKTVKKDPYGNDIVSRV